MAPPTPTVGSIASRASVADNSESQAFTAVCPRAIFPVNVVRSPNSEALPSTKAPAPAAARLASTSVPGNDSVLDCPTNTPPPTAKEALLETTTLAPRVALPSSKQTPAPPIVDNAASLALIKLASTFSPNNLAEPRRATPAPRRMPIPGRRRSRARRPTGRS